MVALAGAGAVAFAPGGALAVCTGALEFASPDAGAGLAVFTAAASASLSVASCVPAESFPAPGAMPAVSRPLPESPIAKLSPSEPVGVGVVCVAVPVLMTAAVGTGVAAGGGVAGAASSPVSSFLPAVLPPPAFVTETGVPVCGTLAVVATAALSAAAATSCWDWPDWPAAPFAFAVLPAGAGAAAAFGGTGALPVTLALTLPAPAALPDVFPELEVLAEFAFAPLADVPAPVVLPPVLAVPESPEALAPPPELEPPLEPWPPLPAFCVVAVCGGAF